ncbi:MAG TPA: sensor domain-containing diguanylate cyclase [Gaiellaceae bacterium]|nr:sensor domain-containing diguanylate cyclase [Gaiellaceae bacterium]
MRPLSIVFDLFRRPRRRTAGDGEAEMARTMQMLEARLEELAEELSSALRRAEEERERSRFLTQLSSTMDLDEALGTTLEALSALPKVDAAVVELDPNGDGDGRCLGAIGLDDEGDGAVHIFSGPPDQREARAIGLSYLYAEEHAAGAVHGALGVPLAGSGGRIGWLGVFSREPGTRFDDEDLRRLEELAVRVAPAIENARKFREARQLADLDSLTGLHNRRFFHETLGREIDRAQRYQRSLSLVIVDVDGFKEINDRIGHLAGDAVLAEIAERLREVVRSADIPCRVGGDEFAVILPEIDVEQARQLVSRIQLAVYSQPIARAGRVRVSAGIAELLPNDNPTSLFERGDESLYAAKDILKNGLAAAD